MSFIQQCHVAPGATMQMPLSSVSSDDVDGAPGPDESTSKVASVINIPRMDDRMKLLRRECRFQAHYSKDARSIRRCEGTIGSTHKFMPNS